MAEISLLHLFKTLKEEEEEETSEKRTPQTVRGDFVPCEAEILCLENKDTVLFGNMWK